VLHHLQGEYPQARQRYEESLAIERELGNRAGIASSLHQLGVLHHLQGEYPQARQRYEESLAVERELGNRAGIASSLHQLGRLAEEAGEYAQAVGLVGQAFAILTEIGSPNRHTAGRTLARLREKMGDEAFREALRQAGFELGE
jgi:tetratricopeptide (TPR) repeat protein